jgi:hypothetical protein
MKSFLLFILLFELNYVAAQNWIFAPNDTYSFQDSFITMELKFLPEQKFEFGVDDHYDCVLDYFYYGKGSFKVMGDSLNLKFDIIPHLLYTHEIDSAQNKDEMIDVDIQVVDADNKPINGITLRWGQMESKADSAMAFFFNEQFDGNTKMKWKKEEEMIFISIEKVGYYDEEIDIQKIKQSDYSVKIKLSPRVSLNPSYPESANYLSNFQAKMFIYSACEIGNIFQHSLLKKGECK